MSTDAQRPAGGSPVPRALGPVVVTEKELALLEAAHHRLLGEAAGAATGTQDAEDDGGAREAQRSMVARGLLDDRGELPEGGPVALLVTTVLDVRLAAERVLVVERIVAGDGPRAVGARSRETTGPGAGHGTRVVHVLPAGACVEDVLTCGSRHLYLLLDRADVVTWVTEVTVPPDAAPAAGPALAVRPDRPEEIADLLGCPTVLAELSVLPTRDAAPAAPDGPDAPPTHHLVALGPSGCWAAEVQRGRALPERVVFRPVHPGWVGEWARWAGDPAPTAGEREEGGGQGTMSG